MSWTQVYVTGLSRSINPSDEEIEVYLSKKYSLTVDDGDESNVMWALPGSTIIKRDDNGCCRGFAFLAFYSKEGALIVVDRINNDGECDDNKGNNKLRAELSNPKGAKDKKKNNKSNGNNNNEDLRDLGFRRQRKPPIRKHPVITSSDGKRTNLGNKTK